jgi:hypothetical protein
VSEPGCLTFASSEPLSGGVTEIYELLVLTVSYSTGTCYSPSEAS